MWWWGWIEMAEYGLRKHPVHMIPVERHNEPIILFVTCNVRDRKPVFADASMHEAFLRAAGESDKWSIGEYLIMPDHIHMFCRPATSPRFSLQKWVVFLKSRMSKYCVNNEWRWQSDFWDTQMRSGEKYRQTWEYIRMNPVKKGLVARSEDWPYQGVLNDLEW